MKTVIIPDIHLRHAQVDTMLSWEEPYDQVIQTGDHFDQFSDTCAQNAAAAEWVKAKLADPRFVLLAGNHDCSYVWSGTSASECSGYSRAKAEAIRAVLGDDLLKLRLHYADHENGILYTHAGLHRDLPDLLAQHSPSPQELTLVNIDTWLTDMRLVVNERYSQRRSHPLLGAGYDRGGYQQVGGVTWADFSGHVPISGLRQICGHTIHPKDKGPLFRFVGHKDAPVAKYATSNIKTDWLSHGWSLCLDTSSHHYAVIRDKTLTIKEVLWKRESGEIEQTVTQGRTIAIIPL